MAKIAGTFITTDSVGNREQLLDDIWRVAATQTPFSRNISDQKANATKMEWQTDDLADATDTNARVEGDEANFPALTPTVRIDNICQIMGKEVIISDTQEAIVKAGRRSELGYQVAKKMTELARDVEKTLTANIAKSNSEPRRMGTLGSWVADNDVFNTDDGASPTGDGSDIRTDGTPRAIQEAHLETAVRLAYTAGGKPDVLMVGPFNKQAVSKFTGRATTTADASTKKIWGAADIYMSDFGDIKVVPNIQQRDRDAWLLDMNLWSMGILRPFYKKPLAPTGDAEKCLIVGELTLVSRNEKGSAGIFDLTVAP